VDILAHNLIKMDRKQTVRIKPELLSQIPNDCIGFQHALPSDEYIPPEQIALILAKVDLRRLCLLEQRLAGNTDKGGV
jgi:hypothetical protein